LREPDNTDIEKYLDDRSRARFKIYENAYIIRLVSSLCKSYSTTFDLLGNDAFKSTAFDYISEHPSNEASINIVSLGFADYIKEVFEGGYIHEMACLELSVYKAVQLQGADPIKTNELNAIQPMCWGALHFTLAANVSIVNFKYDVVATWEKSVNLGCQTKVKELPIACNYVFWRVQEKIKYCKLSNVKLKFLHLVQEGLPFGSICEHLMAECETSEPEKEIGVLLQGFIIDKLLSF